VEKVDSLLLKQADQETRLVAIEKTHKNVKWLAGTMIAAAIGFVFDIFKR
jgi:hypothetical protein